MKYIYMDNYRGFTDTLVPVKDVSFLVGENSTGKSSFLSLCYLFSEPEFWFNPREAFNNLVNMGSFSDLVSARSKDSSYFRVGIVRNRKDNDENDFYAMEFGANEGVPELKRFSCKRDDKVFNVIFDRSRTRFKEQKAEDVVASNELPVKAKDIIKSLFRETTGFKLLPKGLPPYPPIPILLSIIEAINREDKEVRPSFMPAFTTVDDLVWIAPIRTNPQRIYDGLRKSFTPEGEHTPFLLRRSLKTQSKKSRFVEKLLAFGESSGLFKSISTHQFGRSPQAPFEIMIQFSDADLNISNVGYGVSQVLPLIVEILASSKPNKFAIQQPEVHLHPRAQAALGDLFFELVEEREQQFLIETHSEYLIDRFRFAMSKEKNQTEANLIFFERRENGNEIHVVNIQNNGKYERELPDGFLDFFIKEDLSMLEV
ncbi:hypothetical protein C5610_10795 [Idiomarina sp. OT37-5b]|uniref:AAA family ATPase n=1 Tax=Idiomarina sp. OT37-5b TaxID=2100422 RepID=UPI000CF9937B|nr:AAA family ATPase [Idiomarina sp. OT37-5b]AVJ56726.1 hypothetical protein C5610_10795 [Idiomarina sp. OT37-5b]